jgi:trigger factor
MTQVSVEKVNKIERRLTIVVPAARFEEAYAQQIELIAKKASIKGFRPGKVPKSHIQQHYGVEARNEALEMVMKKALNDALIENKLTPVSMPRIEPKFSSTEQPIEFTATFEVLPEIDNIAFSISDVEKLDVEVTNDDVDRVIQQLTKQYTKWKLVDRPAQENDRVVLDYDADFEGKAENTSKAENVPLEIGSKLMLPGFEEALVGTKAGDEKTLNLNFPADFPVEARAGKPVVFNVKVKQVFEAELPGIDEEFVKRLGVGSGKLDELRSQIKQSLEHERDRLVREKLKEQVFGKLIEQNPIDVPNALVKSEAKTIHDEMYPQHEHHDHHQHSEQELSSFNDVAKKRVTLGILVNEYAKKEKIVADDQRVAKRIEEIASAYEHPQDVIKWLSAPERIRGIEAQIIEDVVLDKLMEGLPVTTKKISYAELKGIRI